MKPKLNNKYQHFTFKIKTNYFPVNLFDQNSSSGSFSFTRFTFCEIITLLIQTIINTLIDRMF